MNKHTISSKKIITLLLLLVAVGVAGWWYVKGEAPVSGPSQVQGPAAKLSVVVSGYVPYILVQEIGGEYVEVSSLLPPGVEAHSFEPTPGAIVAVDKAPLFIYTSFQAEPWVADILKALAKKNVLAAGPVAKGEDPHIWLTPYGALSMAKRIEGALSKQDPAHKKYYRSSLKRFEQHMQQLHTDYERGLAHCQSYDWLHIGHLAFGALADTYGLQLQALSGTSHEGEHSAYKLTGMVRYIKKKKLPAIFTEEIISPQLAQTITQETKVRILPLYTIETMTKQELEQGLTYEQFMRRNLHNLQEGLVCQPLLK